MQGVVCVLVLGLVVDLVRVEVPLTFEDVGHVAGDGEVAGLDQVLVEVPGRILTGLLKMRLSFKGRLGRGCRTQSSTSGGLICQKQCGPSHCPGRR
jgi:hypothetical protein